MSVSLVHRLPPTILFIVVAALGAFVASARGAAAPTPRQLIAEAALTEDAAKKRALIGQLMGQGDPAIAPLLEAWRTDVLFVYTAPEGAKIPVLLTGEKDDAGKQPATRVDTNAPLTDAAGAPLRLAAADLTAAEHTSSLRRAMKGRPRSRRSRRAGARDAHQGHPHHRPRAGRGETPRAQGPARHRDRRIRQTRPPRIHRDRAAQGSQQRDEARRPRRTEGTALARQHGFHHSRAEGSRGGQGPRSRRRRPRRPRRGREPSLVRRFLRHAFPRRQPRQHPPRRRPRPSDHLRADARD